MIAGNYYREILFPDSFLDFETDSLLHYHYSVDEFRIGVLGAVKQEFVDIFDLYRLKLLEEAGIQIQAGNFNGFHAKAGTSGRGAMARAPVVGRGPRVPAPISDFTSMIFSSFTGQKINS